MLSPKSKINLKENQIVFWLNSQNYSLEAIYATAYVFINRCYVYLDGDPKKTIAVVLKGKEKLNEKQLKVLQGEFLNELLNYLLRVEIGKRNRKVRESILASVVASSLESDLFESAAKSNQGGGSWIEDPLGIAIPWEEKHLKKGNGKERVR
jgi:His-Xaa-Ser system protein HxsD